MAELAAIASQAVGGGDGRRRAAWIMLAPLVLGLAAFAVYPSIYLLALSFTKSTLGQPFKAWIGLSNYDWLTIGGDDIFVPSLVRATLFSFVAASVELVLGVVLALPLLALTRGARLVRSTLLLPLMTPPILVGVAWKLLLAPGGGLVDGKLMAWGLIDAPISFLGSEPWAALSILVADVWQWTPFVAILAYAAFKQIPEDVHEAAMLDGAHRSTIFWRIMLPLAAPFLLAIFLLRLIMAFKTFDILYVLTFGGPGSSTTMAGFQIWRTALRDFDVGTAAAQTVLFAVLVTLVTLPVVWFHRRVEERAA
jgi:multiple sugar transport system permease protein